ncbi:MAG: SHD1 domain-containing protein [Pirellulaceae bacterium]|nr:SHD1 domain-containing protein [Pirellulaceae bacterium]
MVSITKRVAARTSWVCLMLGFVSVLAQASAQVKLEEGEQVKVYAVGDWRDGVVVGQQGAKYGVEFEFAGGSQRGMFDRKAIRLLCETEAMDFTRTWASESGTFKVDAALKAIQGDKVVLIKIDLDEITVPLASLSKKDVAYVGKLQKFREAAIVRGELPAETPLLPEVELFSDDFGNMSMVMFGEGKIAPLGTPPSFLSTFTQSGAGFKLTRKRQELVAIIPVGGPEQLVLAAVREDNFFNNGVRFPSQLYWASLKQKKIIDTVFVTSEDYVLDYDPRSKWMISYSKGERHGFDDTGVMTAWRMNPGDSKAEPLVRWNAGLRWRGRWSYYAKVINDRVILAKTDRQTYTAWDLVDKKVLYTIKARSFFDAQVVLTKDRQHLIIPEDGFVTVIKADTGELAFQLKAPSSVSGVNVNDAGTKIAALTRDRLYVWELDGEDHRPISYDAPLIGNPFSARMDWLDDDHVLVQGFLSQILFRLSLELPIWSYEMDVWQRSLNDDPLRSMVLNGHFFYTAQPDVFGGALAVGAVKLPGPAVQEVTAKVEKETLYALRPGIRVAIGKLNVSDPTAVRQWLEQKIQSNGWVLADQAEIVINCEMGQHPARTETYGSMRGQGGNTSVTYSPYYSNIEIRQDKRVLWQSGTSTGAPMVVNGDDIQGQVSRMQVPQLQFYETVELPDRIIGNKYGNGFGRSMFGLRGIEVKSTVPVGRADSPEEAERLAGEEANKAQEQRKNAGQTQGFNSGSFGSGE